MPRIQGQRSISIFKIEFPHKPLALSHIRERCEKKENEKSAPETKKSAKFFVLKKFRCPNKHKTF